MFHLHEPALSALNTHQEQDPIISRQLRFQHQNPNIRDFERKTIMTGTNSGGWARADENTFTVFDETGFAPGRPREGEIMIIEETQCGYRVTTGYPEYTPIIAEQTRRRR